jgi:hypothetical protein
METRWESIISSSCEECETSGSESISIEQWIILFKKETANRWINQPRWISCQL